VILSERVGRSLQEVTEEMTMYDYEFGALSLTAWAQLRHTWFAMNRVAEARLLEVDSTPETVGVLWACRDYPGPLHPAEIARLVFRAPHTVAAMLNRLEREGLIERIPKAPGHPLTEVKLTARGEEACSPRVDILKEVIAETMAVLSEEQLVELLELTRVLQLKALNMLQMKLKPSPGSPEEVTIPARAPERRTNE
jgi:DNA-binding MarR family transcriptional regulator